MQLGTVVNDQTIPDLPLNGRDWIQIATTRPAISAEAKKVEPAYYP